MSCFDDEETTDGSFTLDPSSDEEVEGDRKRDSLGWTDKTGEGDGRRGSGDKKRNELDFLGWTDDASSASVMNAFEKDMEPRSRKKSKRKLVSLTTNPEVVEESSPIAPSKTASP